MHTSNLVFIAILFLFACGPAQKTDSQSLESQKTPTTEEVILVSENTEEEEQAQEEEQVQEQEKKVIPVAKNEGKMLQNKVEKSEEPQKDINVIKEETSTKEPQEIPRSLPLEQEVKKEVVKEKPPAPKVEKTKTVSHDIWDRLLRKYVTSTGKVNYKGFKSNKAELEKYLNYLAENPAQDNWPRGKKMAYWINAYNAFTVKLIVDNYPVSSITKLHGGKPWDAKWIELGGKTYSLNNIENDILRPKYKDARIHFAVNCAAKSCPPLLNRAWTANNLNTYFEQQARKFINNREYNRVSGDKVEISKIFEWYAGDFGNIVEYLNKYSEVKINVNAKVSYLE